MSRRCRDIQEILAESGPTALQGDSPAQDHLAECESCYAFLEALATLDATFTHLPAIDAPQETVDRVLAQTQSPPPAALPAGRRLWKRVGEALGTFARALARPQLAVPVAAGALVLGLAGLVTWNVFEDRAVRPATKIAMMQRDELATETPETHEEIPVRQLEQEKLRALGYLEGQRAGNREAEPSSPTSIARLRDRKTEVAGLDELSQLQRQVDRSRDQRQNEVFGYFAVRAGEAGAGEAPRSLPPLRDPVTSGGKVRRYVDIGRLGKESRADADKRAKRSYEADALEESADAFADDYRPGLASELGSPATRFFANQRSLDGLRFQSPAGYWANTYVPGDPVVRWLQAHLTRSDRALLQTFSPQPLVLDAAARPPTQPFDPPRRAALDVFLHADRAGIEREGRVLLQVGLQGAERSAGLRPAMNVAVVLDLRGTLVPEVAGSMRAVVDAFRTTKEDGDRFRLVAAGRPGGIAVAADDFRYGPIQVALSGLLAPSPTQGAAEAPALDLPGALETALESVRAGDDPAAPLGSSLVVLVTGQRLGTHTERLTALAHAGSVAGIPVSVVGIGAGADLDEIERVILAGQGNRRLMHAPAEARELVERELASVAQVIARAVRLKIRLAPGVKLVDVIGSERLDAPGSQRVREAERSIDARLARNLGIEADRSEDEEGIQIVIPALYAGDAHAVLLDVTVPGPGPIASVTARFKDLVHLRNGVARASLELGHDERTVGPLERNVVKNLLAIRLAETLKQAGRDLLEGRDADAIGRVRDFHALLASLASEVPGFASDPDLATDVAMLGEYLGLLETEVLQHAEPRTRLAESLQLAGYHKTLPRHFTE